MPAINRKNPKIVIGSDSSVNIQRAPEMMNASDTVMSLTDLTLMKLQSIIINNYLIGGIINSYQTFILSVKSLGQPYKLAFQV